jgi:hypothetical protein
VHREGRRRALRRRDRREGPGLAAARADGARARPYITVGEPIEAAPQPEAAQPHPAGRYTTELRPGEEAWYAFEVGAGQAITVSTTLPASEAGIPTQLRTELQSERLKVKYDDLATNSGDVLTAKMAAQAAPDFEQPPRGHALVRLEADAAAGQSGPYPIELTVDVTGEVDEGKKPPAREDGASDDGGISAGLAGGLGALVGVALGAALGGLGGTRAVADSTTRRSSSPAATPTRSAAASSCSTASSSNRGRA